MFSFQVQPSSDRNRHGRAAVAGAESLSNPGSERRVVAGVRDRRRRHRHLDHDPRPEAEGVYDLSIAAVPPSRIKKPLGLQKPLAERKIQFVVLDPRARRPGRRSAHVARSWKSIRSIRAGGSGLPTCR